MMNMITGIQNLINRVKTRKYKIWVIILRSIAVIIPALMMAIGSWGEKLLDWLDTILPNPQR